MREYSFEITKVQHDYLLPIFGNCGTKKLLCRTDKKIDKYYFIGTKEDHIDLLTRCRYI